MRIVIDKEIPYLESCVTTHWPDIQVCALDGQSINAAAVREADVLVVRTRTKVDATLLHGSRVRLVCTATIGFDHIDTAYCDLAGIRWTACPGCNAQAVCDYIEETLLETTSPDMPLTLGVVGVGHVGSKVAEMANRRGLHVLLNDPPKGLGVPLDTIAHECDIITFHTPLTHDGPYPTWHLCDASFLSQTKSSALIINAARGGVIDEQALLKSNRRFVLDTWENEPDISPEVVARAERASMHIAGYSLEGKRNATQMCLDAIADTFALPKITVPIEPSDGDSTPGWLSRISSALKNAVKVSTQATPNKKPVPESFERLRKNYILR